MRYITYITESAMKDGKKYSLDAEIGKLASKIYKEQSSEMFQPYEPTNYRKKPLGKNYRLICYEKLIKDYSAIIFLKIMPRGSSDYVKFLDNQNILDTLLPTDKELIDHINKLTFEPLVQKQILSSVENDFLYAAKKDFYSDDIHILESEDWVRMISGKEYDDYRGNYLNPIKEVIENPSLANKTRCTDKTNSKITIMYKYFQNEKLLLLIAPIYDKIDTKSQFLTKYDKILENDYIFNSEEILKLSVKSYPEIITYEDDLWLTIQKNKEGNLALSPEEEEILKNINEEDVHKPKYPLFINGRAGSGKSTILIYLFSDVLYGYIRCHQNLEQEMEYPVFITYSDFLLKNVKDYTKKLFESNHGKILDESLKIDRSKLDKIFDKSFKKFDIFILELLGTKYSSKYSKEKYIDFSTFKRLLLKYVDQNPGSNIRKLSPELCWHVIRTYIKGMKNEESSYLDYDDYDELPRNFKTVKYETYKLVYEKIWKNWYNEEYIKNGYWDSQDITRELLNSEIDFTKFPAVFCDEAQDFTRNELELIFKLSLYSKRELNINILKFIPFAFAGDPFQTLNPTGFDWSSIKANFHEKIVKPLDKFERAKLEFNFNELIYNYRSSKSIVQFSNLIQLLRGVLFKIRDLKPQKSWFKSDDILPEYYKINEDELEVVLKEQLKSGIVIIIPADEGGDIDFIKNDPLLSKINFNEGEFTGNILTPIKAKGLEFSRVILYKFGQVYCENNFNFLEKIDEDIKDPEKYLPFQYFINNLYVASSRAKKRLFIVDTRHGVDLFWQKLVNMKDDLFLRYTEVSMGNGWVDESTCSFIKGSLESFKEEHDNPMDIAEQFYNQGLANKDIEYLQYARQNFLLAGSVNRAKRCDALIFEFNKDLNKAAEKYLEIEDIKSAINCYWVVNNFTKVKSTIERYGKGQQDPRYLASQFWLQESTAISFLNYLIESIQNEEFKIKFLENYQVNIVWSKTIGHLINIIYGEIDQDDNKDKKITSSKVKKIIDMLDDQSLKTYTYSKILFYLEDYDAVIKICEDSGNTTDKNYYFAKSKNTQYPENIEWLGKLGETNEIINIFRKSDQKINRLNELQQDIVLEALLENDPIFLATLINDLMKIEPNFLVKREHIDNIIPILIDRKEFVLCFKLCSIFLDAKSLDENLERIKNKKKIDIEDIVFITAYVQNKINNENIYDVIALFMSSFYIGSSLTKEVSSEIIAILINKLLEIKLDPNEIGNKKTQQKIVDFLNYISNDIFYSKKYGVVILGSCYERSGYVIPSLEFYEKIIQNRHIFKGTEVEINFAKTRWVKSKDRQGISNDSVAYREKAVEFFSAWRINRIYETVTKIPEFPQVDYLSINLENIFVESVFVNDKIGILEDFLERFSFVEKKDNKIIKIKNKTKDEVAMLDYGKLELICETGCTQEKVDNKNIWFIESWNMWIVYDLIEKNSIEIALGKYDNVLKSIAT